MNASLLSERSRVFERADPYAVSGYVNRHVGTHCIRLPAAGRPQASLDHRTFASLDLCRISYGAAVRVTSPALESIFHLQILLRGHCLWRGGGQEHALAPGELLLINPDDPVDLTYSADCEKFIVKLPCALLEAICAEQRWSHPARGVRFLEHRYRLDQLEGFVGLLALVCREAESGERLARVDSHFEQILGSKLLTLLAPAWKTPAAGYATSPNWPWTSVSPTSAASPSNIAGSSASCLRKPCAGAPSADRHGVQESASDPQATDIPSSTRYLT